MQCQAIIWDTTDLCYMTPVVSPLMQFFTLTLIELTYSPTVPNHVIYVLTTAEFFLPPVW